MYQYLKDESYYLDRYDLHTIEECLEIIEMFQKIYDESLTRKELKNISKHEKYKGASQMGYWHLWVEEAERYKKKKETIQKWMEQDQIEQEKYDATPEPKDIYCPSCKSVMHSTTTKHMEDFLDKPLRVMFLFRCVKCKKQEWIYENGDIHISKPQLCLKCSKEIKTTYTKKGKVITWIKKCSSCGYTETKIDDFEKSDAEWKKKEQEEKKLLEKHRKVFCLTDEVGQKYLENIEAMKYANEVFQEEKQKYDNTAYQQITQVKKLSVVELEKLLSELLEKEKYIKLSFDRPEMERFVFVPFTIQDANSSRRENISISNLQKIIKDALENTNWRLTNEVAYRLGYVSGKLKGYEQEEDLMELYGKKKEQKPSAIDDEKRMKYGSNTWVQLARMSGEYEGIEAIRKKRLEKEPNGFFLEADKWPRNCSICREPTYGNNMWWNLDGMRCRDCWRNIQESVIPSLSRKNEDKWMDNSELKYSHEIHPSSIRRLRREKLLHGRDIKRENGSVYYTIYLVSENQEFLKKYPKKKEGDKRMLMLNMEGHIVEF